MDTDKIFKANEVIARSCRELLEIIKSSDISNEEKGRLTQVYDALVGSVVEIHRSVVEHPNGE